MNLAHPPHPTTHTPQTTSALRTSDSALRTSDLELRTSDSALQPPQSELEEPPPSSLSPQRLLTAYGEYLMPRIRSIRPKGFERPGERRTDIRFQAWLRVVTEPRYAEFEPDVKRFYTGEGRKTKAVEEFEQILAVSLSWTPFSPVGIRGQREEGPQNPDLRGALIPVSAAAAFAGVAVKTIHRWIDRGLKHEKRGAYYWVSVLDLESRRK